MPISTEHYPIMVDDSVTRSVDVWDAGFWAGLRNGAVNPTYSELADRLLWRDGWMAGRVVEDEAKPGMSEHGHQVCLFLWAARSVKVRPELKLMYAIPNAGKRTKRAGARMKDEGLRTGFPDVSLPVPIPTNGYGGLFIELKKPADRVGGTKAGAVSKEQKQWLQDLEQAGNVAVACWGWEEARQVVVDYLNGAKSE